MKYDFIGIDKLAINAKTGFGTKFIIRFVFIYQVNGKRDRSELSGAVGLPYL